MNEEELNELVELEMQERDGKVMTGAQRGRLSDLRRKEILQAVAVMIRDAKPAAVPSMEVR